MKSIEILVMVVLGGMGSMLGSAISATVLTILPEALRAFSEYRMIAYAVVLIIVMIFRPQGLLGSYDFSLSRIIERVMNRDLPWSKKGRLAPAADVAEGEGGERRCRAIRRGAVPFWSRSETPNLIPERDLGTIPVLQAEHLGIDFGGLTAVDDIQHRHGTHGDLWPDRAPTAPARPRSSTC